MLAALGVSAQSQVPGAPIALQFGPSLAVPLRGELATTWMLQKGFSDVITLLSTFVLQQQRVFVALDVLRRDQSMMSDLVEAISVESADAIAFDRRSLPQKLRELRILAGLEHDPDCIDLEDRVLSISRVRNCLEHRNGCVGLQDCVAGTEEMPLQWIGPDVTDGMTSATLKPGEYVETLHVNLRTKRQRSFRRATLVTLSAREYVEVCWTVKAYAEAIRAGSVARVQTDPHLARLLRVAA